MSDTNDYLATAAKLSEFLGLLSRGCYVRIGGAVYALFGSDGIQVVSITEYTRAVRSKVEPSWRSAGRGENDSIRGWCWFFSHADYGPFEIMHDPNRQSPVETRNVRRIEL